MIHIQNELPPHGYAASKDDRVGMREVLLGHELYRQGRYTEAEKLYHRALGDRRAILGEEHRFTLNAGHWLAQSLHGQEKYVEAEELFQQTVQYREKVLGKENVDTLSSKHWLAQSLYRQKKYGEAEELFQQTVQGQEMVLGKENVDTLNTRGWLAQSLYRQEKYGEAEELFQQTVQGQEMVLGKENVYTLSSKHSLAQLLYQQKKYGEAEELFQQTVQDREKVLGKENVDTLNSKHWLATTLYQQEKYVEAEELVQQAVQGREKALGKDNAYTLESRRLLERLIAIGAPAHGLTETVTVIPTGRLSQFFPQNKSIRAPYSDSEIYEISSLLKHLNSRWSNVPRTYIILRTIGCLHLLDDFLDLGFSDHWFPVTEKKLPHSLSPSLCSQFVNVQNLVLTKSMDLEKGEKGQHCYFKREETLPFEVQRILGSGGFGQVDRVLSLISFREYARKRVLQNSAFGSRRIESVKRFVAEIEILKRLRHRHVVEFVGSYTDPKYMGLIMSPVAEMDLQTYLTCANPSKLQELRTFFGCLARALEFLHQQNVRHKDIKPSNILVNHGNVLFTDFGLSFDFTDATGSTTTGMAHGMTPKYCAPEVALHEARNTKSDIWSLGVVYLEMILVLKGKTSDYMDEYFEQHGTKLAFVRTNSAAARELIVDLMGMGSLSDNRPVRWIQDMLLVEQQLRPTAASLVASITTAEVDEGGSTVFCGICCVSADDDFSDEVEEQDE